MKTITKIIVIIVIGTTINTNAQNFDGPDLQIGLNDGRTIGIKPAQRALVHGWSDDLIINYNGDFEGGTKIISNLSVNGSVSGSNFRSNGADFVLGLNDGRPIGSKKSQRALVHGSNDNLIINYNGDFEGGTKIINDVAVLGKIESKEVKVTNTPTADFVFDENYNPPTIEFIEEHIRKKQHLPEIASAKEMKKNGVNVGEFQIQLLQKIEELTLYIIDQNKRINVLENKLNQTKK